MNIRPEKDHECHYKALAEFYQTLYEDMLEKIKAINDRLEARRTNAGDSNKV